MYIVIEAYPHRSETGCYLTENNDLADTIYFQDAGDSVNRAGEITVLNTRCLINDAGFDESDPDYEYMPAYNKTASEIAGYSIWGLAVISNRKGLGFTTSGAIEIAEALGLKLSSKHTVQKILQSEAEKMQRKLQAEAEKAKKEQEEIARLRESDRLYCIVSASDTQSLAEKCCLYMKAGYKPVGGPFVKDGWVFQAFSR